MDTLIKKYISRLKSDVPEDDKMYATLKDFLTEAKLGKLLELRNKLYDAVPTGEVTAFELIKVIKQHIGELDEIIENDEVKEGKNNALLQLMHDTMSPVNTIKGATDLLKKSLLPNGQFSKEDTLKLLNGISERADKLNEVLDAYYVSQKKEQNG